MWLISVLNVSISIMKRWRNGKINSRLMNSRSFLFSAVECSENEKELLHHNSRCISFLMIQFWNGNSSSNRKIEKHTNWLWNGTTQRKKMDERFISIDDLLINAFMKSEGALNSVHLVIRLQFASFCYHVLMNVINTKWWATWFLTANSFMHTHTHFMIWCGWLFYIVQWVIENPIASR